MYFEFPFWDLKVTEDIRGRFAAAEDVFQTLYPF